MFQNSIYYILYIYSHTFEYTYESINTRVLSYNKCMRDRQFIKKKKDKTYRKSVCRY